VREPEICQAGRLPSPPKTPFGKSKDQCSKNDSINATLSDDVKIYKEEKKGKMGFIELGSNRRQ
jgi:hypothetical protein